MILNANLDVEAFLNRGVRMITRKLDVNKDCVVRDRACGRVFNASNSCFVACPKSDELGFEIDIIKTVLLDEEIEPYIAVEHFEPARDIFCAKICTKIIESRFCIVLLSDVTNGKDVATPNPNIYYEYGLMTAWNKCIIPIQRADQKLAFNIKSLDTIKYTPSDFKQKISKAVAMQVSTVDDSEAEERTNKLENVLVTYFVLRGLKPQRQKWMVENTNYSAFERFNYGTIVYSALDEDRVYYDTKMIVRRIERFIVDLDTKIVGVTKSYDKANTEAQRAGAEKQIRKLEWQKGIASKPNFTIVVLRPEEKKIIEEKTTIKETSLIPSIRVIPIDELKEELRVL